MLYPIILYVLAGFFGTLLALRLMAIEEQVTKSILTRRGKIVVAIFAGIIIGLIVVFINGMWWNCDDPTKPCQFVWGY